MEQSSARARGFLDNTWKLGGAAGIAFVVLFFAGIVSQGDAPGYGDNITDVRAFYVDHANQFGVGDFITAFAAVFLFLPFAAGLRAALASADRSDGFWPRVAYAGATFFVVFGGTSSVFMGAAALTELKDIDDSTLRFMVGADTYGFAAAGVALGLMDAATAVVILRTGVFRRWLGFLALVAAVLSVPGGLAVLEHDGHSVISALQLLGLLGSALLVVSLSISMLRRKDEGMV